jgi:hypothetical protein
MHWSKSYTRTDTVVLVTCDACGASGQLARCQGTTQHDEQCRGYIFDGADGCKYHSSEGIAARAERAAAKAAKAAETAATKRERAARKSADVEAKRCPAVKADGSPCRAFKTKTGFCMYHSDQENDV